MPTYAVLLSGYVVVIAEDEDAARDEALAFVDLDGVEIVSVELIADSDAASDKEE